jgi:hypothetical protein
MRQRAPALAGRWSVPRGGASERDELGLDGSPQCLRAVGPQGCNRYDPAEMEPIVLATWGLAFATVGLFMVAFLQWRTASSTMTRVSFMRRRLQAKPRCSRRRARDRPTGKLADERIVFGVTEQATSHGRTLTRSPRDHPGRCAARHRGGWPSLSMHAYGIASEVK